MGSVKVPGFLETIGGKIPFGASSPGMDLGIRSAGKCCPSLLRDVSCSARWFAAHFIDGSDVEETAGGGIAGFRRDGRVWTRRPVRLQDLRVRLDDSGPESLKRLRKDAEFRLAGSSSRVPRALRSRPPTSATPSTGSVRGNPRWLPVRCVMRPVVEGADDRIKLMPLPQDMTRDGDLLLGIERGRQRIFSDHDTRWHLVSSGFPRFIRRLDTDEAGCGQSVPPRSACSADLSARF